MGRVITGNYDFDLCAVTGNNYDGDKSAIIEVGIAYTTNAAFAPPYTYVVAERVTFPFDVYMGGLRDGIYYYAAYVKTATGIAYGDVKRVTIGWAW